MASIRLLCTNSIKFFLFFHPGQDKTHIPNTMMMSLSTNVHKPNDTPHTLYKNLTKFLLFFEDKAPIPATMVRCMGTCVQQQPYGTHSYFFLAHLIIPQRFLLLSFVHALLSRKGSTWHRCRQPYISEISHLVRAKNWSAIHYVALSDKFVCFFSSLSLHTALQVLNRNVYHLNF